MTYFYVYIIYFNMSKKVIFPILIYLLLIAIFFPDQSVAAALETLQLWFLKVLPALFPSIMLVSIIIQNINRSPNIFFCIAMGLLCGFPVGCILVCDLVQQGKLSKEKGQLYAAAISQFSPAFLSSYLTSEILQQSRFLILSLVYIPQVLCYCFIYFLFIKRKNAHYYIGGTQKCCSYDDFSSQQLEESFLHSSKIMVKIGCYMILCTLFKVGLFVIEPLKNFVPYILPYVETTSGLKALKNFVASHKILYPIAISACCFGGICGFFQVWNLLKNSNLSCKMYLFYKLAVSVVTGVAVYLLCINLNL